MTMFDRQRAPLPAPSGLGRAGGALAGASARSAIETDRSSPGTDPLPPAKGDVVFSVVRVGLLMVTALTIGVALNLTLVSRLEQSATQFKELAQFRETLAEGTGPIGPVQNHEPLALGTPMALLTIPSIGMKEVVDEGTNSEVLQAGPGHLPSTVFPGGLGTSVIYGRASTYGGPFARIAQLPRGARIVVTIQNGPTNTAVFRVTDIRRVGQRIPPIGRGGARLTLVTAQESKFVPSGAVYVDANIVGTPLPTPRPVVKAKDIPADELPLALDTNDLWILALWTIALAGAAAGAMWTWYRKGHAQAWIIFSGPLALIGYFLANQISVLLPNLM